MKKVISQISLILFFVVFVFPQTKEPQAILLDEFGSINSEETFARLDFFSQEILKTPNSKGLIKIYRKYENCFLCGYRRGSWMDAILKNTRKFPPEKYSIENCSESIGDSSIQPYLLTPSAKIPDCNKTIETPQEAAIFDTIYFYYYDNKLSALEDSYIDVVAPAHGEYSRNALKAVKNILDKSPESKIYIFVYLGTNKEEIFEDKNEISVEKTIRKLDKQSTAIKLILNAKNELVKNGIKSSQIKTVNGGYLDGKRELQFWFVPKSGEIPKPKPDYFLKKNRKTKANKFN